MDAIIELWTNLKSFIIREFLWFFLSLFIAMLLTLLSFWLMHEFSFSLVDRLEWQGMEKNSIYLLLMASWFVIVYLVRLVRGAILFLMLPKEVEPSEE